MFCKHFYYVFKYLCKVECYGTTSIFILAPAFSYNKVMYVFNP
jgi:hypothetical protein